MENPTTLQNKKRLDVEMLDRGLARSRSVAKDLIERGLVSVNGTVIEKAKIEVLPTDAITIGEHAGFVSRAGEKLEHALKEWKIDVEGLDAIDVGSSTGGFTDCLLRRGIGHVVAIDVGTDQFVASLRENEKVELHEGVDVRRFSLPSPVDLAVVDVSFISLALVLPKVYEFVRKGGQAIVLVKPQFEVGRELASKRRGVIRDDKERIATLEAIKVKAKELGFKPGKSIDSPIEGEGGNREFLLHLKK